ncbi:DUF4932 domain-containing protein [Niabella ginsengisoli]|uniref:DUF4932 domain-containing protein n=1 Tax=Niabella ginsengisoli TaxID=522298 RepID=A0ABS9SGA0_9BACT|nr:DUF4932 domain-containing protein [Niabella ginsengisoli]MCH5597355.1 DUF4932 domain-containing protein [Niabella ginsengisoli]
MNQFFCIIYLSLLIACSSGESKKIIPENQSLQPRFDIRVELISIVLRLASYDEYNMPNATNYINRIHDHYDHYKDHELIQFAKKLRIETGMGFDGPMSLAVHLKYSGNKFSFMEYSQNHLDSRWSLKNAKKYVHLLNDFYIKSNSSVFLKKIKNTIIEVFNYLKLP